MKREQANFIRYNNESSNLFINFKAYKVVKYDEILAAYIVKNEKYEDSVVPIEFCLMVKDDDKYCLCDYPNTNSSDTFTKCHDCQRDILF